MKDVFDVRGLGESCYYDFLKHLHQWMALMWGAAEGAKECEG